MLVNSEKYALAFVLSLTAAAPAVAAGHYPIHGSVPPASFLNYHVSTVHELSQEVTLDPAVRTRLASHFHISEAQMTKYVRENLVLTHLRKSGRYNVACVGRDGREFWVESRLPAGTAIFASRATGHPVLKLACGNPMVSSLPPTTRTASDITATTPAQLAFLPSAQNDAAPMPGLLTADVTPADLIVADAAVAPAVVQVSPSFQTFVPGSLASVGSRSFNILPALLGAAAIGVASSGHGSTGNDTPVPAAVPEASSMVSLGIMLLLGAGTLVFLRRKRNSDAAA